MVEIISQLNETGLGLKAATIIKESITRILEKKSYVVVAIPGGRSIPLVFGNLKKMDIPWINIHIFMVDERLVPIEDPESNFKLANDVFIKEMIEKKGLPKENVHPFIFKPDQKNKGIDEYKTELENYGGKFDIVFLSSGEDGHVAGLYPNHHSIKDDSDYFLIMDDSPKPPKDRMTASRKLISSADSVVLIFKGEAKKEAFDLLKESENHPEKCPARIIYEIKNSFIVTDLE
jgi:6-phosphogluconolactonase